MNEAIDNNETEFLNKMKNIHQELNSEIISLQNKLKLEENKVNEM